jgi:hypothetical protein
MSTELRCTGETITRCCALLLAGCVEPTTASDSTVDQARVITVLSEPSEGAPGANVHLRAIVAAPPGVALPELSWSVCTTPRGPTDNTAASPACAERAERPLGLGAPDVDTTIPLDACKTFGSETPAGTTPNAPDSTGGYYQPYRVAIAGQITVFRLRIRCALPAAPIDVTRQFTERYRPNDPPGIANVTAVIGAAEYELRALPWASEILLRAELSPPESYLLYEPGSAALTTASEQQTSSWFASVGFVTDATWHVPANAQAAQLWLVARDDRGASTFEAFNVQFTPP